MDRGRDEGGLAQEPFGTGRRLPIAGQGTYWARPVDGADPDPRRGDNRAPNSQVLGAVLAPATQGSSPVEAGHGLPGTVSHARGRPGDRPHRLPQRTVPSISIA